jgi:3-dehydroquinate synthase
MLLEKLGKGVEVHEMDPELIVKALHLLQHWEEQGTIRG